ncbi:MAG: UDP-2,3-diacylglucosamine pyrophosphatase, partial [Alphaproteobacteria bacterium RIFOXYD12_FULL_60_8]
MRPNLGILAGSGELPGRIIEACRSSGRGVFVVAFAGQADSPLIEDTPHTRVRLGAIGAWLSWLKEQKVEELVMAGPLRRPGLADLRPDLKGIALLAKTGALALGDDGLLKACIRELENEGFRVVGIDAVLEDIVAPLGTYGARQPDEQALADIHRGREVAKGLGALDVGQAVVVQQGIVLAVEAIEGTAQM